MKKQRRGREGKTVEKVQADDLNGKILGMKKLVIVVVRMCFIKNERIEEKKCDKLH